MKLRRVVLGVVALGACAGAAVYTNRRIDDATSDLSVDDDHDDDDELWIDPEMLRRIRALACGIRIDAETGDVTPDEALPPRTVILENVPDDEVATYARSATDGSSMDALLSFLGPLAEAITSAGMTVEPVRVDGREIGPDGHPVDEVDEPASVVSDATNATDATDAEAELSEEKAE
jgi:hypothetical protein